MSTYIFDTETTGSDAPEVIEAAWLEINNPTDLDVLSSFEQRYKPSKPIELGALATHHIYDEELIECPPSSIFKLPEDTEYIIGHNVDYDWNIAGNPDVKRICTLALSRYVYPTLDSHSQSAMIYKISRPTARDMLRNAHSALADVKNCLVLLTDLISKLENIQSWDDLWVASEKARIPTIMPFGKHKGTPIDQIPADYKQWLLRQSDVDPYLLKALS